MDRSSLKTIPGARELSDAELAAAIPERLVFVRSYCGENKRIDGEYDRSLAVKCVNGTFVGEKNGDVIAYRGIPFVGEQPTGENRWKKPVDYSADTGIYTAYYYGKAPVQNIFRPTEGCYYPQGEDCLYLNVWVNTADRDRKKPVMVWIYGGSYDNGATANPLYVGDNFVKDNGDVIYCSISYRVGMFGFFNFDSLPDGADYPDAKNLGILDQIQALKWIHENIAAFGGDPDNVTIWGQSAGAGSAALLASIKEARQYFNRVILQSGGPDLSRSKEQTLMLSDKKLEILGCKSVADLKKKSMEDILAAAKAMPFSGGPTRDGVLIPKDVYAAYADGTLKNNAFLLGCNKDEACTMMLGMPDRDQHPEFYRIVAERFLSKLSEEDRENLHVYIESIEGDAAEKFGRVMNQSVFFAPLFHMSELLSSNGGTAFHYFFTEESSIKGIKSGHTVELASVHDNPQVTGSTGRPFSDAFNHTMQRMWVNFAKTGDPSLDAEESPTGEKIEWPEYDPADKQVMVLEEKGCRAMPQAEIPYPNIDWKAGYPLVKYDHI